MNSTVCSTVAIERSVRQIYEQWNLVGLVRAEALASGINEAPVNIQATGKAPEPPGNDGSCS